MADAPIQLDLAERIVAAGLLADLPAGSALRRRRGGTGFSVETLAELQAELGIGATPSEMTGATSSTDGTGGIVPQPLAGDQARALVGAATFSVLLEIQKILDATGVPLCDFEGLGDMLNRIYVAAAASGGQKARVGARGADTNIDVELEPKGGGDATVWADPIETLIKRSRGIFAQADAAAFEAQGCAAPTVESFDTAGVANAPLLIRNAQGPAVQPSTDDLSGSTCGFMNAAGVTQRLLQPSFYWFGESNFVDARVWFASCLSDPVNATDLVSLPNPGVALWVDYAIHAAGVSGKELRLITCSGPAMNVSGTGVFSVDSSGRLDRNDGGDWVVGNARVDDLITISGFTINPSNNGPHRVVSFVGAPVKRRIVLDPPLLQEVSPAGAVTVTHPGQVELNTGLVITANAPFGLRLRYLPQTFQWEVAVFNFVTRAWGQFVVSDGVAPVPSDGLLRQFQRLRTLANAVHRTAGSAMFFRRGV